MPNWNDILNEVQRIQAQHSAQSAYDDVRRAYLLQLHEHVGRNVIAYYSGWLSKPSVAPDINDEDKNAFMMAIHEMKDRGLGLDLILHTPGGGFAATQSIVDYLHKMFGKNIRAVVPQLAMSAGTMIACSCKEILMGKQSNLGPIDPHLQGAPAVGVINEFKRAACEIKKDPSKIAVWEPIISQYRPTFLSQCEQAIQLSNEFVQGQLEQVMFEGDPDAKSKASRITNWLSDYTSNKSHDRHIHADECKEMGLKVLDIEKDPTLQDLVLSVHHCYMHAFMNTTACRIVENHLGRAMVRQVSTPGQS